MQTLSFVLDFQWTHALPPGTARLAFMLFFAAVTLAGVLMTREHVYRGAEDRARWRDLRLWVAGIMALQVGIYLVF